MAAVHSKVAIQGMNVYARSDNEPMRPAAVAMSRTHPADQEALRHLEGHGIPNFVGWVGGLAVMAGIGAAMIIGGWSGVASADGTDSSDGSSTSPSSPSDPSPAQQAPRPVARTIHDALSPLRTLATPGGLGFAPQLMRRQVCRPARRQSLYRCLNLLCLRHSEQWCRPRAVFGPAQPHRKGATPWHPSRPRQPLRHQPLAQ